jgi:hypothetical protein
VKEIFLVLSLGSSWIQGALTAPGASQSLEALRPTVGAEGRINRITIIRIKKY